MTLKYMDKYWKESFDEYGEPILKRLIGVDVTSHKKTETVQIDPSSYNRDMVFEKTPYHWIVVEFQHSKLNYDDLVRFALYAYSLSRKYNVFVSLYVICGPEIKNPKSSYKLDENNSFNVNIISMRNYDGDETFEKLFSLIKDSSELSEDDISELMLLPLMSSKNTIYTQLKKSIELANTIENLENGKLNMIKNAYFILSLKFSKNKQQAKNLIRLIMMKYDGQNDIASQLEQEFYNAGYGEGHDAGYGEGHDAGYGEGRSDLISQLLADGVIIENVEKYLDKHVE